MLSFSEMACVFAAHLQILVCVTFYPKPCLRQIQFVVIFFDKLRRPVFPPLEVPPSFFPI